MRVLAFLLLATAACAQTTFPAWVFQKKTSASSASVPVVISGQNNKVFGLDGSGNLSLLTNGSGSSTLAGLGDVAITGIANEDLLRYDTNESKWLNISSETLLGAPVIALRDLADGVGALTNDGAGVLSWVSYQEADAELTALAGLTSAADKLPYFTGSGTASTATVTSASRTLLSKATVGQMLEYIGAAASYNGSSIDTFSITSTSPSDPASLNVNNTLGGGGVAMNFTNATGSLQLLFDNLTAARTQRFPNADGTLISTGNLTAITATGTVASGTWNGSAIGVAYGGTGSTSLTANNVLLGNGTSALQAVAPGTSGNVLTSNGTTWTSAAPAAGAAPGGSGSEIQYRSGASTFGAVTGSSTANGGITLAPSSGSALTLTGVANAATASLSSSMTGAGATRSMLTISDNWTAATGGTGVPRLLSLEVTHTGGSVNWSSTGIFRVVVNSSELLRVDHNASFSWATEGTYVDCDSNKLQLGSAWGLNFAGDAWLYRDAANVMAHRNGTNAQAVRVYETDSGNNDEYVEISAASGTNYIKPAATGTGTASKLDHYVTSSVFITSGAGSPEAAVTAPVGSLFIRTDGGASTTLYVKESGSGNTGWVAK